MSTEDRNFVTALARGLEVLACFRPGETHLTNADIAARTGLPKPTVSRLSYTLRQLGYLAQDPGGAYRLDAGVLTLGFAVLSGISIAERAQSELTQLRAGPNPYVAAGLMERHKLAAVTVAAAASDQTVSMNANVGARMPLFLSAAGLAILVQMAPDEIERATQMLGEAYPSRLDQGRAALAQAQQDLAAHGYVRAYGLWRNDVNGIAVPVQAGGRLYGLAASGPAFAVSPDELEQAYAPLLLSARARLVG